MSWVPKLGPEAGSRSWVHHADFGNGYPFTSLETYNGRAGEQGGEQEGEFGGEFEDEFEVNKMFWGVNSG